MTTPFDDSFETPDDPDTRPAPGGPNDPGASASDENQADTPGYSGGGDDDPTMVDPDLRREDDDALLDDPELELIDPMDLEPTEGDEQ